MAFCIISNSTFINQHASSPKKSMNIGKGQFSALFSGIFSFPGKKYTFVRKKEGGDDSSLIVPKEYALWESNLLYFGKILSLGKGQ